MIFNLKISINYNKIFYLLIMIRFILFYIIIISLFVFSFYFIIFSNLKPQVNEVSFEIGNLGPNKGQQPISLKLGVFGDTHIPENDSSYRKLIKVLTEINE